MFSIFDFVFFQLLVKEADKNLPFVTQFAVEDTSCCFSVWGNNLMGIRFASTQTKSVTRSGCTLFEHGFCSTKPHFVLFVFTIAYTYLEVLTNNECFDLTLASGLFFGIFHFHLKKDVLCVTCGGKVVETWVELFFVPGSGSVPNSKND